MDNCRPQTKWFDGVLFLKVITKACNLIEITRMNACNICVNIFSTEKNWRCLTSDAIYIELKSNISRIVREPVGKVC